ncbi:MAG: Stp1/IreP family PP2C-type Ser/Thr phosphatase [Oscillospiraceae bacterium]|jgi:protein phosphatase|nr:Stp1/IreP family PP2C-type Ser/Thr phosphatase [Oscillospiraceae bacterium]
MRAVSRTDTGRVRVKNEDAVLIDPAGLYIVADGMGGHRAGEIASSIAAQSLRRSLSGAPFNPGALAEAVSLANQAVYEAARSRVECQGMGTTITLLWAAGSRGSGALIAQIGDSRAYLLRDDRLHRCTRDHSIVDEMLRKKLITPSQARVHPDRSVITRAVGVASAVKPDLFEWDRQDGDLWLLCSDGLTDMLDDAAIASILRSLPPEQAADTLLSEALERGGPDNISILLVSDAESGDTPPSRRGKEAG